MSNRPTRKETQARTRERLVTAAAAAFREHGFHRASAEAIAAEAGFTRGALYANFDGKDGLFLAVLDEELVRRQAAFRRSEDPGVMARRYQRLLDRDPGWTLALLEFTIHAARHPPLAVELRRRNEEIRLGIEELIRSNAPDLDAATVAEGARAVLAINTGVSLERALDRRAAGAAELVRVYRETLRDPG
jgi:AcrR family transcriptional regulator